MKKVIFKFFSLIAKFSVIIECLYWSITSNALTVGNGAVSSCFEGLKVNTWFKALTLGRYHCSVLLRSQRAVFALTAEKSVENLGSFTLASSLIPQDEKGELWNRTRGLVPQACALKWSPPVVWRQLPMFAQTGKSYLAGWFTAAPL